jgi:hypothetical protein
MKSVLFVIILCCTSSCATMFNSGSQTVQARSSQGKEGVAVDVVGSSGSYSAKLPLTIVEAPSTFAHLEIKVSDPCYNANQTRVSRSITPSYWANILVLPQNLSITHKVCDGQQQTQSDDCASYLQRC